MKCSRQNRKPSALLIASTFSLCLLSHSAPASPFRSLDAKVESQSSPAAVVLSAEKSRIKDKDLQTLVDSVKVSTGKKKTQAAKTLKEFIRTRGALETFTSDAHAVAQAKEIEKSPLYHDDRRESSNWFGKAAQQFFNWFGKLINFNPPDIKAPGAEIPSLLGTWAVYFMWGVLGLLLLALVYFAARHARWKSRLRRKAAAMLDEDEPERTLDEWLARADELEMAGKYREAVRCLFLACLLKFDEARVAKFDRGQTNWEHLGRIKASPLLPETLNFEPATIAFDLIWYGMRTKGAQDVQAFRQWYLYVGDSLAAKPS